MMEFENLDFYQVFSCLSLICGFQLCQKRSKLLLNSSWLVLYHVCRERSGGHGQQNFLAMSTGCDNHPMPYEVLILPCLVRFSYMSIVVE